MPLKAAWLKTLSPAAETTAASGAPCGGMPSYEELRRRNQSQLEALAEKNSSGTADDLMQKGGDKRTDSCDTWQLIPDLTAGADGEPVPDSTQGEVPEPPSSSTDELSVRTVAEPVEKEDARETIRIIEEIQRQAMDRFGIHFAHASDELYLTAELPLPEEGRYDGYLQLENGVGMLRLLDNEVDEALERTESLRIPERVSAVSGMLAGPWVRRQLEKIGKKERGRGPAGRCHAGGAGRKARRPLRDHRILRRGPGKRSE